LVCKKKLVCEVAKDFSLNSCILSEYRIITDHVFGSGHQHASFADALVLTSTKTIKHEFGYGFTNR
jgi:hypothetical protein